MFKVNDKDTRTTPSAPSSFSEVSFIFVGRYTEQAISLIRFGRHFIVKNRIYISLKASLLKTIRSKRTENIRKHGERVHWERMG